MIFLGRKPQCINFEWCTGNEKMYIKVIKFNSWLQKMLETSEAPVTDYLGWPRSRPDTVRPDKNAKISGGRIRPPHQ